MSFLVLLRDRIISCLKKSILNTFRIYIGGREEGCGGMVIFRYLRWSQRVSTDNCSESKLRLFNL